MDTITRKEVVRNIDSKFIILDLDGSEHELVGDVANIKILEHEPALKCLVSAELLKGEVGNEPKSIKAMRDLELVDYEPASDKGHFRFYPKGALVFNLLHAWAEEIALNRLQAFAIETPIIYDYDEPDIKAQAESFHEHHYRVQIPNNPDKKFILRFAGDFGLFRMMRDAQLTYRHLPVRMYEFAPSFRYENSGSLAGLRRLRGFWMPDVHSFCLNLAQGLSEYNELFCRYTDLTNGTGVQYAVAFRVVDSFYKEHKHEILEMIRYCGKPAYIEILSDMKHYWVLKHEINTIDGDGGVCQVSTVQLDIKDASLYGIEYIDQDGQKKGCTIVHSSIGSPERWLFSILEDALKKEFPELPLWLSPTQIRILPVSNEKHLNACEALMSILAEKKIRVDIDDRPNPLSWRIRQSEREWIPYQIVIGDKEADNINKVNVRIRGGEQLLMDIETLIDEVTTRTKNMPWIAFPARYVSKRPIFRGRD